jgi:hypothetical protein
VGVRSPPKTPVIFSWNWHRICPVVDNLLVRFFIAITDSGWFSYLSTLGPLDEVNFWQPSGSVDFKALLPGEPFLGSEQEFVETQ